MGFYYFILIRFDPNAFDKMMELAAPFYEKNGISLQQINDSKESMTPFTIGLSVVFTYSVIGLLISLLTSFFNKRTNVSNDENTGQVNQNSQ